ncbi:ABC transporter ATP-binding protein [Phyllobacterium myrsinacearum]|uniref:Iron(III) transport system ATP-binding protein n=1 Tax=Phyllobacterium myrsinacearum TaxID=28101 RepID=A0A839ENJ1_9HYPH|nr:ABC transporter ATP-binding protein [Phyllobacterium myrsinacearum]MBA8880439.1 iron(III) transport system ATP-binding protein [Phyllobacterium myrsinacearum]
MTFLDIRGVTKRYGVTTAVDDVTLSVAAGSRTAIVGPSGSGKTTLLRLIGGFEAPDSGQMTLNGEILADGPAIVPAHRRSVGFVTQDGSLFPHLTIADNIGFGLDKRNPDRPQRILELMDMVELDTVMLGRRPHQLSGGQQQRVSLARALARQPKLMLLDEPFSALDTGLRENMRKAVAAVLKQAGITTILVTHDQAEALSFADQVAVMRQGKLVQAGSPRTLYLNPADRTTASFLGDAILLPAELGDGWIDCVFGRLSSATNKRRGTAEIMLRPEQLKLVAVPEKDATAAPDSNIGYGKVIDIEFGGAVCTVALAIVGNHGTRHGQTTSPVQIKCSAVNLPATGDHVRIEVLGEPHIFA